jgi:putative methyltransferase (TIGR04325 family)
MKSSSIKLIIKECIPPIALKFVKKKLRTPASYSSASYSLYEDAMKYADGYEDEVLTRVVVAKGKRFADEITTTKTLDLMSLRTFVGLASSIGKKKLTVIDFGGAAGTHYFIAKSLLTEVVELDWRVVETSAMVAEAKRQGLETDELHFFDNLDTATEKGDIDLVFASGSIHYTPKPYDFLTALASINANVLMITRTPITDSPCVILQRSMLSANGVGGIPKELGIDDKTISFPATMMDRRKVETILLSFGEIALKIVEDKAAYMSDKGSYDMWGYIVRRA